MKVHQTLDDIRRRGLDALLRRLGRAGMVRFLQQFEIGQGDYATKRHEWVDRISLDELKILATQSRRRRKATRTPHKRNGAK